VALVAFLGVINFRTDAAFAEKRSILTEDLLLKVQKEVQLASRVEDGYLRNFTLPSSLGTTSYEIDLFNNTIVVSTRDGNFSRRVPPVQGTIVKGLNQIEKRGGELHLNE